jgi:beta-glucosidase
MSAAWPEGFLWGASTSAYQIEGATDADGRGPSIWDEWAKVPGRMRDGETGEPASGHYHRWREDVALLRELGARAYRFSIAWPRVQPLGRGAVNAKGLDFYDRLTDALCAAGIVPVACLYHWDLPQALQEEGGWPARDIAGRFADYAAICAARLADRIALWATFNEPGLFTMFGHLTGGHPPGIRRTDAYLAAMHHVNLAHGGATRAILAVRGDARVACVHNVQPVRPATEDPADVEAAAMLGELWNRALPDPQLLGHYPGRIAALMEPWLRAGDLAAIRAPAAWVGVNHYSPVYAKHEPSLPFGCAFTDAPKDGTPATPINWRIEPGAFRDTLREVHARYRLPVVVTENGYGAEEDGSSLDDQGRIAFHRDYVAAMREARAAGADIRGYLAWTLLDNLEWSGGRRVRFGLVRVEPDTQERRKKASFAWFADTIRSLPDG